MVSDLVESHVEWTTPQPLWLLAGDPAVAENRRQFRTPAILRFASDSFMAEFLDLLKTEPQRLQEFLALPETWNSPPGEPAPPPQKTGLALKLFRARAAAVRRLEAQGSRVLGASQSSPDARPLKLYQPVHQRFYLVATCLVCRVLGLPDRRINTGAQERATFVLRLLQPHADALPNQPDPRKCDEFALVNGAWTEVAKPDSFVPGEEQHPLSPAAYQQDDLRRRRLLVGLVPVGDRERLLQAVQPNPSGQPPLPPLIDAREMLLKTSVIGPIKNLQDTANNSVLLANQPPFDKSALDPTKQQAILDLANQQIQQVSWYILLDLARYLRRNASSLWQEIQNNGSGASLPANQQPLWNTLSQTSYQGTNMIQALSQAYAAAGQLESIKEKYPSGQGWPGFLFQFYQATLSGTTAAMQELQPPLVRDTFEPQIVQALDPESNPPMPVRLAAQARANPQGPVWFTIRCVLERPNCGALTQPLVSEPTQAFQLAGFFDPDAPARPIRIGLPVDTTPAGLRKFDKNTAFVMSDTLCRQVKRMNSLGFIDLVLSVLPFPLHKGLGGDDTPCGNGVSAGMVCSFSIPIITICALILLIIFVKLLDIIFFWMPFFQICLPLPKFSAKDSQS